MLIELLSNCTLSNVTATVWASDKMLRAATVESFAFTLSLKLELLIAIDVLLCPCIIHHTSLPSLALNFEEIIEKTTSPLLEE